MILMLGLTRRLFSNDKIDGIKIGEAEIWFKRLNGREIRVLLDAPPEIKINRIDGVLDEKGHIRRVMGD